MVGPACFVIARQLMRVVDITERTFLFACRILELCEKLQKAGGVARDAAPRLLRSGTAIGANLKEAVGGPAKPDFVTKACIAQQEAREAQFWLRLLQVRELPRGENLGPDIQEADAIIAILAAIATRTPGPPTRGL
jgi:four helix bundle protein